MLRLAKTSFVQQFVTPPIIRSVHITPGFLSSQIRAKMAQPLPRDRSPFQDIGHVDKKPRLEVEIDTPVSSVLTQNGAPEAVVQVGESSKPKAEQPKKQKSSKRKKKSKFTLPEPCSADDVVSRDVFALLGEEAEKAVEDGSEWDSPFEQHTELEVVVSELSSSGDSLSLAPGHKPWVILAPLALPGERIRVRVYYNTRLYSRADLLEIIEPNNELRDMSRVKCKYFGKCGGCQYQMLSYDKQLGLKRNVVVKAYKNFSGLPESSVPEIQSTIGSPLQYGYRTKITPHFEVSKKKKVEELRIGFNKINTKIPIDIEECPIATDVINEGYGPLREKIHTTISTYKRGASLLLRESLKITPNRLSPLPGQPPVEPEPEQKVCVTNHKDIVRERVGDMLFEFGASSFFQNNNSILVPLTSYVRDAIFPPSSSSSLPSDTQQKPTHLVDAYCGSGLFALTLSPHFDTIAGIELSTESIKAAKHNATLNNLATGKCSFLEGDASNIFATVQSYPRDQTAVIIDPPRKGSDEKFIDQLIEFRSKVVVYVSCNVHTQARDVGMIVRKSQEKMGGKEYVVESIRGFDLFPQTSHVESVAVLRLVNRSTSGEVEMQS